MLSSCCDRASSVAGSVIRLSFVLLLTSCSFEAPTPPNFSSVSSLRTRDTIPDEYLIVFKRVPGLDATSRAAALVSAHGGQLKRAFRYSFPGFWAILSRPAADSLRALPEIEIVEPVIVDRGSVTATPDTGRQYPTGNWGLDRLDEYSLWPDTTYVYPGLGAGVHVYVIDTGIHYSDPEFEGRAVFGVDFVTPGGDGSDCSGLAFHGTSVAGIIGSHTYGVAKAATIVSVRTINCQHSSPGTGGFVTAIEWVTEHAVLPAVANVSLRMDLNSPVINAAISGSTSAGITWVAGAGNDAGDACDYDPAGAPDAITVAASGPYDYRWPDTNTGNCVDIYAPGQDIWTLSGTSGAATVNDGTSLAAPFVAGVAAAYLGIHPTATPGEVTNAILAAGYPYTIHDPSNGWCCTTARLLNTKLLFPSPSPLTVSITGKSYIKPNQSCVWKAVVQGATGVVEYRWRFEGHDSGVIFNADSIRTQIDMSGSLSVEVTSAGGTQAGSASKTITVGAGGSYCVT